MEVLGYHWSWVHAKALVEVQIRGARAWEYSFESTDNDHQNFVYIVSHFASCVVHRRGQMSRAPDCPIAVLGSAEAMCVAV